MLSESDYQEAVRRYKNMRVKGPERQRCHALSLVHQGYSYREVARILLVDEETLSRWVRQYQERGLEGLQNDPQWGGEHGQRELSGEPGETLKRRLGEEARAGTKVGSGWPNKAVGQLIAERFGVAYSKSGLRKLFAPMGWS
jgi:transposase